MCNIQANFAISVFPVKSTSWYFERKIVTRISFSRSMADGSILMKGMCFFSIEQSWLTTVLKLPYNFLWFFYIFYLKKTFFISRWAIPRSLFLNFIYLLFFCKFIGGGGGVEFPPLAMGHLFFCILNFILLIIYCIIKLLYSDS